MDEKLRIRFQNDEGGPMAVTSIAAAEGITFDKPKDASPLNIAFGLQAVLPGQLDRVRLRHDWREKQFAMDAVVDSGTLLLSGHDGDREGLPPGPYDITVEVESYRFHNAQQRIVLKKGETREIVLKAQRDPRKIVLLDNFDRATAAVVESPASSVDGMPLAKWISSETPRAARRACLLNMLTKLAAPPMPGVKKALVGSVQSLHFGEVDRVYAAVDPSVEADLHSFVKKAGWAFEGRPKHPIHKKLITDALKRFKAELKGKTEDDFTLASFRQGGRTCMQIVLAIPKFKHPSVYADIDIDLGNPLWDLDGLFVHLGELLDSGPTDHFDVWKKLKKAPTNDFVFYDVKVAE